MQLHRCAAKNYFYLASHNTINNNISNNAESNGKLPQLFVSSKTATLIPAFAVEGLPLDTTATLVPAFAVKALPLGRKLKNNNNNNNNTIKVILNSNKIY